MDILWILTFSPITSMGSNNVSLFFDSADKCKEVFDRYQRALEYTEKSATAFTAEDLMGQHVLRPDFYPMCTMKEMPHGEKMWHDIDSTLKKFREQYGPQNQPGFRSAENNEKNAIDS